MHFKEDCIKVVEPWMRDANINPDQYHIVGKQTARKFKVQFKVIDGLAAQLAARALRY